MDDIQKQLLKRLEDEAASWIEEELGKRMAYAKEAIEEQVQVSLPEIGPGRAEDHRKKSLALAEREIRLDLEFEAQQWIEAELKKGQGSS